MKRLTKKDYCGYDVATRKEQIDYTCEEIFDVLQKLGKLEDLFEKYGIEDVETLDEVLKIHKFLLDHDYTTMPREDFDGLIKSLKDKGE